VIDGGQVGRRWRLKKRTVIGRDRACEIIIEGVDVSRRHAKLERTPLGWWLTDLDSRNGVSVNDRALTSKRLLKPGDRVRLGRRLMLLFTFATEDEVYEERSERLQSLGRLSAGVAHDFNNVLFAALCHISWLREECAEGNPEVLEALEDINSSLEHGRMLAQQLCTFAANKRAVREQIDLASVVTDVLRLVRASAPASIEIRPNMSGSMEVLGTRVELTQVVMNLCVNAVDAMPDGGQLSVSLQPIADCAFRPSFVTSDAWVVLHVADTGTGIPPEIMDRIFDPYFTSKGDGGSGIGLATVYGAVKQHGGDIDVESVPGLGTDFRIFLPLVDGVPDSIEETGANLVSDDHVRTVGISMGDPTARGQG